MRSPDYKYRWLVYGAALLIPILFVLGRDAQNNIEGYINAFRLSAIILTIVLGSYMAYEGFVQKCYEYSAGITFGVGVAIVYLILLLYRAQNTSNVQLSTISLNNLTLIIGGLAAWLFRVFAKAIRYYSYHKTHVQPVDQVKNPNYKLWAKVYYISNISVWIGGIAALTLVVVGIVI